MNITQENISEEIKLRKKKRHAERMKRYRERKKLAEEKILIRNKLSGMTDEEKDKIKNSQKLKSKQIRIETMTDDEKNVLRKQEAKRKKDSLAMMTDEEKSIFRKKDLKRKKIH